MDRAGLWRSLLVHCQAAPREQTAELERVAERRLMLTASIAPQMPATRDSKQSAAGSCPPLSAAPANPQAASPGPDDDLSHACLARRRTCPRLASRRRRSRRNGRWRQASGPGAGATERAGKSQAQGREEASAAGKSAAGSSSLAAGSAAGTTRQSSRSPATAWWTQRQSVARQGAPATPTADAERGAIAIWTAARPAQHAATATAAEGNPAARAAQDAGRQARAVEA